MNFIIPTPKQPHDVCFGGKNLSELFIACGDAIYKRKTTAHGIVSGQMAPFTPRRSRSSEVARAILPKSRASFVDKIARTT